MSNIHKTAVISESAVIGKDVTIGPYSIIGDKVTFENLTISFIANFISKSNTLRSNISIKL